MTYLLRIMGEEYPYQNQFISGRELKELANIDSDKELYLSMQEPWDDQLIEDEETVNLGLPGIESFEIRKPLTFLLNGKTHTWHRAEIPYKKLSKLAKLKDGEELFLVLDPPNKDEMLDKDKKVNLARPGVECIVSRVPKTINLFVNGKFLEWSEPQISYDDVVKLAFGGQAARVVVTVTYSEGPVTNLKGVMVSGSLVNVKHKMIFNATRTSQS